MILKDLREELKKRLVLVTTENEEFYIPYYKVGEKVGAFYMISANGSLDGDTMPEIKFDAFPYVESEIDLICEKLELQEDPESDNEMLNLKFKQLKENA